MGSFLENQLSNLVKYLGEELKDVMGVKKEIKNVSSKLEMTMAVLNDAEKRSIRDDSVKHLVEKIQNFFYDADDVVDEWLTRRRLIERSEGASSFFFLCLYFFRHFQRLALRRDIAQKIKELDSTLEQITEEIKLFSFLTGEQTSASHSDHESWRITTAFDVDESEIQGRKSDASALISRLVENEEARNGLPVISIVGQGGIGKTTLAQLVYMNERIQNHFPERVWICVSDPFDEIKIAKAIVESMTKSSTNLSQLQALLQTMQSILSEKMFLLVLDDVWLENFEKWNPLKNTLKFGHPGSRILVTSRKENVAKMMGSKNPYQLGIISDSDAWLLLRRIAFSGRREEEASEKLKNIGQKIAQKCRGLPLAAKVMGGLLFHKHTEEQWQYVLNELDIKFSNVEEVETKLFPHLYLSYNDLTPEMKRCFSYCAVFPKDYEIKVEELIRIWMAQDYLTKTNTGGQNQMELKGQEVFEKLVMRSLFQDFVKDDKDSNIIISCKMHDIVHDFAEFVTKSECYSIGKDEDDEVKIENKRHFSWQKTRKPMDPASIYNVIGKLRSFFAEDLSPEQLTPDLINGLKSVRVLGLRGCKVQKLPKQIGNLLHLRYIDLSHSEIEELPDTICSLINLQTLDLRECKCLSILPIKIGNLCHLKYINLSGTKIKELPDSIYSLSNLKIIGHLKD